MKYIFQKRSCITYIQRVKLKFSFQFFIFRDKNGRAFYSLLSINIVFYGNIKWLSRIGTQTFSIQSADFFFCKIGGIASDIHLQTYTASRRGCQCRCAAEPATEIVIFIEKSIQHAYIEFIKVNIKLVFF